MEWKTFITSFGLIFLAELGDKTQLAALTLSADSGKPVSVFLGASLALILVTLIGVAIGDRLAQYLPPHIIHLGAGILFIAVGGWLIWGAVQHS